MKKHSAQETSSREKRIRETPPEKNPAIENAADPQDNNSPEKRKITSRQIVALAGVALLVLLYLITFITAITDSSDSAQWFRICLSATFALPVLLWLYSWMYGRLTGKSAIGDPSVKENSRKDDFT